MKRKIRNVWITSMLVFLLFVSGCSETANYLAKVQDTLITEVEFDEQWALLHIGYEMANTPLPEGGAALQELKREVLDALIEGTVLAEEAEERALVADEAKARQEAEQLLAGMVSILGEETLDKILIEHKLDGEDLERLVHQQSLHHHQRILLYEEVTKGATATRQELEAFYEENKGIYNDSTVHAKGLIFREKSSGEKARNDVPPNGEEVDAFIKNYENQAEVSFAGDFGPVFYGDLEMPIAQALFQGKVGEWTPLLQGDQGYYLVYVYGKQMLEPLPLTQVLEAVENRVLDEKKKEQYEIFVQKAYEKREIIARYDVLK